MKNRKPLTGWLIVFVALLCVAMVGFQVYTYFTTWMWQSLVVAGGALVASVLVGIAAIFVWRDKAGGGDDGHIVGYLLIAAILVAYSSGELALAGNTLVFAVGGGLSLLLVTTFFFPGRGRIWVAAVLLYWAILAAINALEPIRRYDATFSSTLTMQLLLMALVGAFFGVWFLVRAVLGAGTIRTRLLISFVGLVLIP
ncbi:MAG: hypothetical protein JXA93_14195, partial [Anaerolineae bacterium]|nr:hypothetical protein [Anaerolineae bacterium]